MSEERFTNYGADMAETMRNIFDASSDDYKATLDGCQEIVDEWQRNKGDKFDELFKNIPGFDKENHCIVLSNRLFREADYETARAFLNGYLRDVSNCREIARYDGKDKNEWRGIYLRNCGFMDAINLLPASCLNYHGVKEIENLREKAREITNKLHVYTPESEAEYQRRNKAIGVLVDVIGEQFISEETADRLNEIYPELKIGAGKKLSKVVRKFCYTIGVEKDILFERMFAQFADSVNPIELDETLIISWHPFDYLTMSHGNNWTSCHDIGFPDAGDYGCYSSGTLSYMLDNTSIICYAISRKDNISAPYWDIPKVHRQMFHVSENGITLIQARLYPDDQTDYGRGTDFGAYKQYREIVQDIIAKAFNLPNLWKNERGTEECRSYIDGNSRGTNYADYCHYENCNVSTNKSSADKFRLSIGHLPICPSCGKTHHETSCCSCYECKEGAIYCTRCGGRIDRDEAEYIDGEYYCHNCCDYCEYHEEYEYNQGSNHVRNYGYVCDDALREMMEYGEVFRCEDCGDYVREINVVEVEDEETGKIHFYCDNCR